MTVDAFSEYFQAVHKQTPFPWQERLARRVVAYGWGSEADPDNGEEGWTDRIALPTAAGKTSAIDIAVFHLALQLSNRVKPRNAPLRIFFVIDRRIVVDEAFQRACRIARALSGATEGILKEIAEAMRSASGDEPLEEPLQVSVMRGGMYRDDGWVGSPVQPTVCVSTIDQVGSRLLFRGYGLGEFQRPIHAGLIGCDSLIIVDEAHLSNPCVETLEGVKRYAGNNWVEKRPPVAPSFSLVQMTATPRTSQTSFTINASDRANQTLSDRLKAGKATRLIEVETKSTNQQMSLPLRKEIETANVSALIDRLVGEAKRFAGLEKTVNAEVQKGRTKRRARDAPEVPPARVIGVVVNRVATARGVLEKLQLLKDENCAPRCHVILLTGRSRPYDRDDLLHRVEVNGQATGWMRYMRADRTEGDELGKPLFVVATQTVEVGADLSFDALVTEVASLDALRQRFGRLDRLGKRKHSQAVIVARKDKVVKDAEDRVYGQAIPHCWKQLYQWATVEGQGASRSTVIDFGLDTLQPKIDELRQCDTAALEAMCAPIKHAPVMLPAHVDAWCQTSPSPAPDPDVALFLHGPNSSPPDVQVVWRADLPDWLDPDRRDDYVESVNLVPPTSLEALPVPIYQLRVWLRENRLTEGLTDVEGVETADEEVARRRDDRETGNLVLRWRGPEDTQTKLVSIVEIRPGDTIVVPSSYGGCDPFGWSPTSPARVRDVADPCARLARWRPVLRLHPAVLAAWNWEAPEVVGEGFPSLLEAVTQQLRPSEGLEEERPDFEIIIRQLHLNPHVPSWVRLATAELGGAQNRRPPCSYPNESGWLLERRRRLSRYQVLQAEGVSEVASGLTTEDDTSWMTGKEVALDKHLQAVQDRVRRLAAGLGLESICEELDLAGALHDIGKTDPRFQVWLHDGDEVAAAAADKLLAKSGKTGRSAAAIRRARELAGYPKGGRHECLSVSMVMYGDGAIPSERDRELVAYLVGVHHGRGRPFIPVVPDPTELSVEVQHNGHTLRARCNHQLYDLTSGWTDLFWRMIRRYGYWGLAYLEAIIRLADQAVSQMEQKEE